MPNTPRTSRTPPKMTYRNTATELEQAKCNTLILPVGAIEQHGSHLPLGTDWLLVNEWAERISGHLGAYLLPALPVSSSIEHRQGKGTVYLRASTLSLVVEDIAKSASDAGFSRLIVMSVHGGNWILKPTVRQLNRDYPGLATILVQLNHVRSSYARHLEQPDRDVHAGEMETSLMLHLYPEWVKEPETRGESPFYPQEFMDYFDTSELTPNGVWGYPELAASSKGEAIIRSIEEATLQYLNELEEVFRRIRKQ